MASGSASKAAKRELKKAFGPEIAEALDELRGQLATVSMEHRVVAREMHEQERALATVRQAREHDKKQAGAVTDDLRERVDALALRCDGLDAELKLRQREIYSRRERVAKLEWLEEQRAQLTRWQRFCSFVTGAPAVRLEDYPDGPDPAAELAEIIHNPTPAQREEFAAGTPAWTAQDAREGER